MKNKLYQFGQFIDDNNTFDVDEAYLEKVTELLGRIVIQFNSLESYLDSIICFLINDRTDQLGATVIVNMSYSLKVDLFKRMIFLYSSESEKHKTSILKLLDDLKRSATLRNASIHANWENVSIEDYTYVRLKFRKGKLVQEYVQFTTDSLLEIVEFINKTNLKLGNIIENEMKIF